MQTNRPSYSECFRPDAEELRRRYSYFRDEAEAEARYWADKIARLG